MLSLVLLTQWIRKTPENQNGLCITHIFLPILEVLCRGLLAPYLYLCTWKNPLLLFQKRLVMSSITIVVSSIQSQSKKGGHIYTYIEEKSKTDPFERPSFFGLFCSQLPLLYLLVSVAKRDKMPPFDFNVQQRCFLVFMYSTKHSFFLNCMLYLHFQI